MEFIILAILIGLIPAASAKGKRRCLGTWWAYALLVSVSVIVGAGDAVAQRAAGSPPTSAPAQLRGVFRDPNDGRPVAMWTLDTSTRMVKLLDGSGRVVGSGVIHNLPIGGGETLKNTAEVTTLSGAIYYLRWEDNTMSLFNYRGTRISNSNPTK